MENVKRAAELVGVCVLLFSAIAFAFALGYLNQLGIPETPTLSEALTFYLRAIENTRFPTLNLIKQMLAPFLFCWLFIKGAHEVPWTTLQGKKALKYLSELSIILVGCALLWAGAMLAYNEGQTSLPESKAEALFPLARPADKVDEMRLVWLGHIGLYWIECNELQSQLVGYKDGEKIFLVRRLDPAFIQRFCS